ncbi:restriction endonuclease subunit S [Bacteroides ovatus]|jgi:type I restriction enzyme S subunit|nr:restriction endonuclease subunit S [Bacteroides ovatus]KAA3848270.1 restriction endonuclease subunit S [Bacteroides ovatus]KAA3871348.1 restriction endonuclease subunit S [Bacteroides ovatus]MCE8798236.1 restriction endonuclease subunit S [Bacteroides ovatus]UYI62112.1 MAG: restriction endonuclease subunit S [Bacteroides ovatus]
MIMANNNNKDKCNVPHLRFPEFSEEWEICKVSELLDFYSTNSLSWEQLEYGTKAIMNLHYGLIHVGLPTMVDLTRDNLPNIKEDNMPKNFELCKEGDVAFADASEDTNEVAKPIEFFDLAGKNIVCGLHTIHGRDNKNKTVIGFKGYAFSSSAFHNQIRRIAQGTKIYSISTKNFSECFIGIPSKVEQTKIATLLRLIDERIATQNKIIEDLKKLKSAIIDYAINSLDTDFAKFGSLYETAGEGGTPTTSNASFYDNGKIPFVKIDDLKQKYLTENKDFITELGLQKSSAWLVPTRSILFSNGATIGEITITTYPVCTKQGILGIVPKSNIDVEFLYYFMSSTYFKKAISRIVTEGTMKTAYLKDIANILCPIPTKEKQQGIAKMPSALNSKIDYEQSLLKLFIMQKQYLLRQMFI